MLDPSVMVWLVGGLGVVVRFVVVGWVVVGGGCVVVRWVVVFWVVVRWVVVRCVVVRVVGGLGAVVVVLVAALRSVAVGAVVCVTLHPGSRAAMAEAEHDPAVGGAGAAAAAVGARSTSAAPSEASRLSATKGSRSPDRAIRLRSPRSQAAARMRPVSGKQTLLE